jgi:tripartite-type tricarboxylate transporter receptor subunit TctC
MNQFLYRTPPYDPIADFAPVTLVAKTMQLLIVNSASEVKTVQDLIGKARASAGKLNFGAGTITTKLTGFLFNKAAGVQTVLVPYNGSAEVTQGLLTKSVDFTLDGPSAAASLIQSGQFRVLAKFDDRPFPPAANAPTIQTALPGLDPITVWLGLVAPKGTPPAIVASSSRRWRKLSPTPPSRPRPTPPGSIPRPAPRRSLPPSSRRRQTAGPRSWLKPASSTTDRQHMRIATQSSGED